MKGPPLKLSNESFFIPFVYIVTDNHRKYTTSFTPIVMIYFSSLLTTSMKLPAFAISIQCIKCMAIIN